MANRDFVDHTDFVDPVGKSEPEIIALLYSETAMVVCV